MQRRDNTEKSVVRQDRLKKLGRSDAAPLQKTAGEKRRGHDESCPYKGGEEIGESDFLAESLGHDSLLEWAALI